MCGIVGFTGKKNLSKLSSLLVRIEHRGRDGRAMFYDRGIHLGMNRLAIIDLSPNLYPMKYKQYRLIFNGEIYNYQDLKQELIHQGISFSTTSDAEVILPLFALYGLKAFDKLEGMFAICIYDRVRRRIILARDKSGEKPLYYMQGASGFVFASEMKVLLSFDTKKRKLNRGRLPQYLTQGFIYAPDTLVREIKKIPPSSYVMYDIRRKTLTGKEYWEPVRHFTFLKNTEEGHVVDYLDALLRDSVRLRLLADVPVGCFLSGGVDSSLVTLFAAQQKRNMHTFSVSFPGYARDDESHYASRVAKQLGTNHTVVRCTPQRVYELFKNIGMLIDEPIVDPAFLPTLLMAEEARKHVKVVLTGEGADELFGGYSRYMKQLVGESIRRKFPFMPHLSATIPIHQFQALSKTLQERYSAQGIWNTQSLIRLLKGKVTMLFKHRYLQTYAASNPLLSMQLADYRGYMAEQLLMKIDKSTMAKNLESRAPYLDSRIISFAFGLPPSEKIRLTRGKYILKKVAERYFPQSFVWRSKHGFDVPLDDWFRKDLREFVYQSADLVSTYNELFITGYYEQIVSDHMKGTSNNADKIWSMIVLTDWLTRHHIFI